MSDESGNGAIFELRECPVVSVVVYMDRAEVCREVEVELKEGNNDVVLKNLSRFIDQDSIRVEGKGSATITEVAYSEKRIATESSEATEQKIAELHTKREELLEKKEVLLKEDQRCEKQRAVLDGLADKIKEPHCNEHGKEGINPLSEQSLGGLKSFLNLYGEQAAALDEKRFAIKRELTALERELAAAYDSLGRVGCSTGDPFNRQVCIALNAHEAGKAVLLVSYLVSGASWSPKYDMRVFSQEMNLRIMYYGMIEQSTGEDWDDVKLSLSTATPSVGGEVPVLGTEKVSFKREIQYAHAPRPMAMRRAMPQMMALSAASVGSAPPPPAPALFMADVQSMAVVEAKVTTGVLSATFDVSRPATIPSDGVGHKVTVAIIDLKPTFEHVTIPNKVARVFMKAKVKNESPYVLLAGPTNVFLDNNFVAKASISSVSPSEEFDCSLGVDNAVRVTYKPQRKFHEQTGMFSKGSCITYVQEIEVKNTREQPVRITVEEHLPLSAEDKIKVNLLEPQIPKEPSSTKDLAPVSMNKLNNIVWRAEISAGKVHDFVLRYSIEHPRGETIELTEEAAPVQH